MVKFVVFTPIRFVALLKRRLLANKEDGRGSRGTLPCTEQTVPGVRRENVIRSDDEAIPVFFTDILTFETDDSGRTSPIEETRDATAEIADCSRVISNDPQRDPEELQQRAVCTPVQIDQKQSRLSRRLVPWKSFHVLRANSLQRRRRHRRHEQTDDDDDDEVPDENENVRKEKCREKHKRLSAFNSKLQLLITLLPMLQETITLFDDLYKAGLHCTTKGQEYLNMANEHIDSRLWFILTLVAIAEMETVLEILFWILVLALCVRPPQVFHASCQIIRMPVIAARMCRFFQGLVHCLAVFFTVISFHGGLTSFITWALLALTGCMFRHIGALCTIKSVCAAVFLGYTFAPHFCRSLADCCVDALKAVPGVQQFRVVKPT